MFIIEIKSTKFVAAQRETGLRIVQTSATTRHHAYYSFSEILPAGTVQNEVYSEVRVEEKIADLLGQHSSSRWFLNLKHNTHSVSCDPCQLTRFAQDIPQMFQAFNIPRPEQCEFGIHVTRQDQDQQLDELMRRLSMKRNCISDYFHFQRSSSMRKLIFPTKLMGASRISLQIFLRSTVITNAVESTKNSSREVQIRFIPT